jgi:hypothetical protein
MNPNQSTIPAVTRLPISFSLAVIVVGLVGCSRKSASLPQDKSACEAGSKESDCYELIESHASRYVVKDPISESYTEPARYVIKHGNVLIQAHCGVLVRREGYDNCETFPDPIVPLGVPLTMTRDLFGICWTPWPLDGVCFVVDSEKVKEIQ